MPATAPTLPFPLQAPSQYTTSHSLTSSTSRDRERFLVLESVEESLVDASAFEASGEGTPRAKYSASLKVANFLYFAFGKPVICFSQSALERGKTFNLTRIYSSGRYMPSFEYASLPPSTNRVETALRSFCGHIQLNELSLAEYYEFAMRSK